jgi:Kef-type K+ transport system membrane component KefB
MKAEVIFSAANVIAIVGWLLLAIGPGWGITRRIVLSGILPLFLSIAYLVLILLFFGRAEGGFGSLADVMKLFTNEWAMLAGWIHYLAFDMFIGAWEVRDAQERGVSHILVIPCLVLTFLLGPIGLLLYHIIRHFAANGGEDAEIVGP